MQQDCWSSDLGLYWLVLRFTMSSAMRMIMIGYVVGLAVAALGAEEPWQAMYDGGFKTPGVKGWSSQLDAVGANARGLAGGGSVHRERQWPVLRAGLARKPRSRRDRGDETESGILFESVGSRAAGGGWSPRRRRDVLP